MLDIQTDFGFLTQIGIIARAQALLEINTTDVQQDVTLSCSGTPGDPAFPGFANVTVGGNNLTASQLEAELPSTLFGTARSPSDWQQIFTTNRINVEAGGRSSLRSTPRATPSGPSPRPAPSPPRISSSTSPSAR